jgi:hypothetical protein
MKLVDERGGREGEQERDAERHGLLGDEAPVPACEEADERAAPRARGVDQMA